MSSSVPAAAFTTIQGPGGKSMVLYVDDEQNIQQWSQNDLQEALYKNNPKGKAVDPKNWNRTMYDMLPVRDIDGTTFDTCSKDLSVSVVLTNNTYQIRVFYANAQNILCELCMDLEPEKFTPVGRSIPKEKGEKPCWFRGKLDEEKFKIKQDSPIASHVTKEKGNDHTLKVYYFPEKPDAHPSRPAVAWIPLDYTRLWQTTNAGI